MAQVIYLEEDEGIETVRERLESARTERVLLVIPKKNRLLESRVGLKLLRRQASDLAMELALVIKGGASKRRLAKELGFSVFSSVERGERSQWRSLLALRGRRQELAHLWDKGLELSPPKPGYVPTGWGRRLLELGLMISFLVFLSLASLMVLPGAKVILVPSAENVEEAFEVVADASLEEMDSATGRIPARTLEVRLQGEGQMSTTAQKDVPDARATGGVTFFNRRSEPTIIPEGTIVSTSGGTNIRFRTTEEAILPAVTGVATEVAIVALDPGLGGNVAAYTINRVEGALGLQVIVRNAAPTTGGTVKRVYFVTAEDKRRLQRELLARLRQEASNMLRERLREREFFPIESMGTEILSEVYDKAIGEEAPLLTLYMQIEAKGLAISEEALEELALYRLKGKAKQGFDLPKESLRLEPWEVREVGEERITLAMKASGLLVARIDEEEVKKMISGARVAEARERLAQNLALEREPEIEVRPDLLGRLPWLFFRIQVLRYLEESG